MVHFSVSIRAAYAQHYHSVLDHVELYKHFSPSVLFQCDFVLRMAVTAFLFCYLNPRFVLMTQWEGGAMSYLCLFICQ